MLEDAAAQDTPPDTHGAQLIHLNKSMLRRVQLGHGNEMNLERDPVEHPVFSFNGSPPESTTTADPETAFNIQTPEPGPHPEGGIAQIVQIKSCLLEDATVGNNNKMTIHPRSKGGAKESADSEELKEDTGEPGHRWLCVARPHSFICPQGSRQRPDARTQGLELSEWTKSQRVAQATGGCRCRR